MELNTNFTVQNTDVERAQQAIIPALNVPSIIFVEISHSVVRTSSYKDKKGKGAICGDPFPFRVLMASASKTAETLTTFQDL